MRRKIPESTLPKLNRSQMITAEGLEKLREEHDHLWKVERPDTTAKVSWAAVWEIVQKMPITTTTKSAFGNDNRLRICESVLITSKSLTTTPTRKEK